VVEEKVDGANAALRFDSTGTLLLQSRGHYLQGGAREKHFDLFKRWASSHAPALYARLGDRYVLYGEWLYAKHTIFYDALPHYFLEFDILDTTEGAFLSTARRRELLDGAPVVSVPVLSEGVVRTQRALSSFVGRARYKTAVWKDRLRAAADVRDVDADRVVRETDPSDEMEGLYIKIEEGGRVRGRFKFVRHGFLTSVTDSGSHWLKRPIVPNELAPGVDIFGGAS
jgi:hypothetical protein